MFNIQYFTNLFNKNTNDLEKLSFEILDHTRKSLDKYFEDNILDIKSTKSFNKPFSPTLPRDIEKKVYNAPEEDLEKMLIERFKSLNTDCLNVKFDYIFRDMDEWGESISINLTLTVQNITKEKVA